MLQAPSLVPQRTYLVVKHLRHPWHLSLTRQSTSKALVDFGDFKISTLQVVVLTCWSVFRAEECPSAPNNLDGQLVGAGVITAFDPRTAKLYNPITPAFFGCTRVFISHDAIKAFHSQRICPSARAYSIYHQMMSKRG